MFFSISKRKQFEMGYSAVIARASLYLIGGKNNYVCSVLKLITHSFSHVFNATNMENNSAVPLNLCIGVLVEDYLLAIGHSDPTHWSPYVIYSCCPKANMWKIVDQLNPSVARMDSLGTSFSGDFTVLNTAHHGESLLLEVLDLGSLYLQTITLSS